jgi:hypothetical protein
MKYIVRVVEIICGKMKNQLRIEGQVTSRLSFVKFVKEVSGMGLKLAKDAVDDKFPLGRNAAGEIDYTTPTIPGLLILDNINDRIDSFGTIVYLKDLIAKQREDNPKLKINDPRSLRKLKLHRILINDDSIRFALLSYIDDLKVSLSRMTTVRETDKILYEYCNNVITEHIYMYDKIQANIEYNLIEKDDCYCIICDCNAIFIDKKVFLKYIKKDRNETNGQN